MLEAPLAGFSPQMEENGNGYGDKAISVKKYTSPAGLFARLRCDTWKANQHPAYSGISCPPIA